jgi:hypothetical protein
VDDYSASIQLGFYFLEDGFGLSVRTYIRAGRLGVGALAVFSSIPAANASQSSTTTPAAKKPAATTITAHKKLHRSTAKSSAGTTKSTSVKGSSKSHAASTGRHPARKKTARTRGQQKIDSERAQAIQEALIREHYMSGEATGTWNQASEEAMRRYQADHGWQSKTVPDSRALIKLGLGPSKDHLLNPESAMTTGPDAPRAEAMPTSSHSASPGTDPAPTPNQNDPPRPQ